MIYEPAEDSNLIQKVIKNYVKGKSVLDLGTGSGILAETAVKYGASSVLAADINLEAIENIKNKKIKVRKSDIFSNIKEKFDVIICNPPYLPLDKKEDKESQLITTGGKKGDEFIVKFLKQSLKHLNKSGIILLLLSSLTPRNKINLIIKKYFNSTQIAHCNLFMERLEVLELTFKSTKSS